MTEEKQIEDIRKVIANCDGVPDDVCRFKPCSLCKAERLYNAGYRKIPDNIGDFSDGYHTFNELYHHRAVLFSVICNMFPEKAWKSKLHDTGDMYEGMFIVGIETEQGQATYHYDIEPYWDMFKVKELDKAPKWDGHTPSDAIERIGNLSCEGYRKQNEAEWISVEEKNPEDVYGKDREKITVLVCTKSGKVSASTRCARYSYDHKQNTWVRTGEFEWSGSKKVTHWMPMPNPYRGRDDQQEGMYI